MISKLAEIFLSYSHKDEDFREQLEVHLSMLKRQGIIKIWHDRMITAGSDWQGEIDENLNSASIILLLISANFLASDYCYDIEMNRAIERHNQGEACIIPIILKPVEGWDYSPFATFQVLPKDRKPISSWNDQDEAFVNVAEGIREKLSHLYMLNTTNKATKITENEGISKKTNSSICVNQNNDFSFANIAIDNLDLNWTEERNPSNHSFFGINCKHFFTLKEFVFDANLSLDVTLLNLSTNPVILTAVGIELIKVAKVSYLYGIPQAAKIYKTDSYKIELPDLWERFRDRNNTFEYTLEDTPQVFDLHEVISLNIEDPVYLQSKAPYRYQLFLRDYQRRILNHAILRLWVRTSIGEFRSELIELFTL